MKRRYASGVVDRRAGRHRPAPHRRQLAAGLRIAVAGLLVWSSAQAQAPARDGRTVFDCLIEPAQVVEIRSPVIGLLDAVHVRRGETIRRGQVLVTIESGVERSAADAARFRAQAEGALQVARARLEAANAKARRMEELLGEAFVSVQARDDAVAEARLIQAELKSAEENAELARLEHRQALEQLQRRTLRSPFNGVVVDQYLYPGALVDGSEGRKPILKIAETQPLAVQVLLPARYLPQVKVGAAAVVVPESPFSRELQARIALVDRVVDAAAGTFGVVLHLPNARNELPGGIRCKLHLPGLR